MSVENFSPLKTPNLDNLDIYLIFSCKKEYRINLLKSWNELLDEFSFLSDFFSDYVEPQGKLLESIENMDKNKQPAWSQPAYINKIKRWIIVLSKHFFEMKKDVQKAIILHEIGHIVVYEFKIFGQLRSKWIDGESLFEEFYSKISIEIKLSKSWVKRNLYDISVFDMLKIPGEVYANIWVKDNCGNYLILVLENQLENYKNFFKDSHLKMDRNLLKFPLISTILRLENLLIVLEDEEELSKKISQLKEECSKELEEISPNIYNEMNSIIDNIKKIIYDTDKINSDYFDLFIKFFQLF